MANQLNLKKRVEYLEDRLIATESIVLNLTNVLEGQQELLHIIKDIIQDKSGLPDTIVPSYASLTSSDLKVITNGNE